MSHLSKQEPKGVVLIFTVLAIGVAGFLASLAVLRASISSIASSHYAASSIVDNQLAKGCLDEVIIQFRRDENFANSTVTVGSDQCDVVITSPTATQRDIVITTGSETSAQLSATVDISTFEILSIEQE